MNQEAIATASLNGHPVAFRTAHRDQDDPAPVLATIALPPAALSYDDLVAVLYREGEFGTAEEFADDASVRRAIVDTVANGGLFCLQQARGDMAHAERWPDTDDYAWLEFCRRRVAEVFSLPASRPGRVLAGTVA